MNCLIQQTPGECVANLRPMGGYKKGLSGQERRQTQRQITPMESGSDSERGPPEPPRGSWESEHLSEGDASRGKKRSCFKQKGLLCNGLRPRNSLLHARGRRSSSVGVKLEAVDGKSKPDRGKQWSALEGGSAGRQPSHIGVTSGTHG